MLGINAGSGQRPFDKAQGWCNIDKNPKWGPDIVGDWNDLSMIETGTVDYVVSHHSLEHVGCGEGDGFIRESHRVLKQGGSLLIFIPDPVAICRRYLLSQIDEYTFNVNMYGAYMGDEADRHRWSYSRKGLVEYVVSVEKPWFNVKPFDWRKIPGADIAGPDWWINGAEFIR